MSTSSSATKDAYRDFYPGAIKPEYRYKDTWYRKCYDGAWARLQEGAEGDLAEQGPTLEERVATLEEQVAELIRSLGL